MFPTGLALLNNRRCLIAPEKRGYKTIRETKGWLLGFGSLNRCYWVYGETRVSKLKWKNQRVEKGKEYVAWFFSLEDLTVCLGRVNWVENSQRYESWWTLTCVLRFNSKTSLEMALRWRPNIVTPIRPLSMGLSSDKIFQFSKQGSYFLYLCIFSSSTGAVLTLTEYLLSQ